MKKIKLPYLPSHISKGLIKILIFIVLFSCVLDVHGNELDSQCSKICLECINSNYISILQTGKCILECGQNEFLSLKNQCYLFINDTISLNNIMINNINQADFYQKPIIFKDLKQISIFNLTMFDVQIPLDGKNITPYIFGLNNVETIIINTVNIIKCFNLPTIIRVQQVEKIIYYQDINISKVQFRGIQNIFQNINGNEIKIFNISASQVSLVLTNQEIQQEEKKYLKYEESNNYIDQWEPPIHASLFQSNGFSYISLEESDFKDNERISLLECYNFYFSNEKQVLITKSQTKTLLSSIRAFNNKHSNIYKGNTKSLTVLRSHFSNNKCILCQGSAIFSWETNQLQITQSTFLNNTSLDGGAIYLKKCKCLQNPSICISFSSCQFTANNAIASGGAIMLDDSDINFQNDNIGTIFNNNQAIIGGAIRYITYIPYYFQKYNEQKLFDINYNNNHKQLIIFNNKAEMWGKNIGSYPRDFKVDYSNPKEVVIPNSNKNMLKEVENSPIIRSFQINDIRSGQIVKMRIAFLDEEFYPILINQNKTYPLSIRTEIQRFTLTVTRTDNITEIDGDYYKTFDQTVDGIFTFDELRIYAKPTSSSQIIVSTNMIKIAKSDYTYDIYKTFQMSITIQFRHCKQGEIYSKYNNGTIYWCEPCDFGKYSLDYPKEDNSKQICKLCPENTVGCQENLIILKNGYWRNDNNSDIISECYNNLDNCKGQMKRQIDLCNSIKRNSKYQNYYQCKGKEGHTGPLCEGCDISGKIWGQKYRQSEQYECQLCNQKKPLDIAFAVLTYIVVFGYNYIGIKTTQDMNYKILVSDYLRKFQILSIAKSAIQDETPFYIKSLTHYILIFSAINKINIEYFQFAAIQAPKMIAFPFDSIQDILDCIIGPYLEQYQFPLSFAKMSIIKKQFLRFFYFTQNLLTQTVLYKQMLYGSLISVTFIPIYLLIEKIFTKSQNVYSQSSRFNGFIYFTIFFLPSNMKNSVAGFFCRQIGNQSYVKSEMSQKCFSEVHLKFMIFLVPALISQCFLTPLYSILDMMSRNRDSPSARLSYGFLFVGFKKKYYFWEFVRIYFRVAIIAIVSSSEYEGQTFINWAVIILLMLIVYLIFVQFLKPYDRDKFNQLENISNVSLIVILVLNIFIKNSDTKFGKSIGEILISMIHFVFLGYLIILISLAKIQAKFAVEYNGFKSYHKRTYPKLFYWLQFETINKMRVYRNWKNLLEKYVEYKIKKDRKTNISRKPSELIQRVQEKLEKRKTLKEETNDILSNTYLNIKNVLSFNFTNNNELHQSSAQSLSYRQNSKLQKQQSIDFQNSYQEDTNEDQQMKGKCAKLCQMNEDQKIRQKQKISNNIQREQNSNQNSFIADSPISTIITTHGDQNRNMLKKSSSSPFMFNQNKNLKFEDYQENKVD